MLLVGCGPAVVEPEDGASGTSSTAAGSSGTVDDDGGTTAWPGTDDGGSSPGSTGVGSSSGVGSSTSEEMFEDGDVIGSWLCEGDDDPFVMHIDDYASPSALQGRVCAAWNGAEDPLQWEPCGDLSAHPIGGGPYLPIYAMIDDPVAGETWTVSADLIYDVPTDSMKGFWHEMPGEPIEREVACVRVE